MKTTEHCPCDPDVLDAAGDQCHPYLRTSFQTAVPTGETFDENCLQKSLPCNSCCVLNGDRQAFGECTGEGLHYRQMPKPEIQEDVNKHLHCVAHTCPLGTIVCCSPHKDKSDCRGFGKDIIKAADLHLQVKPVCEESDRRDSELEKKTEERERPCCVKKSSWTEPRLCRCDLSNPMDVSQSCQCECGATIVKESKPKTKKRVRFEDQATTNIDCDKAFRNLSKDDVKYLCSCCKDCAIIGKEQCVGKPVLVYELPEPKFEGKSVTHKDFCWQKTPQKEIPPWHPNVKDRWRHLDVPSLSETTYQCDYKPPVVLHADREPVYLAPQKEEKSDPCQQLAEEYTTWKKTSTGPPHVYHSSCDNCDKDLHRVHLHECNVAHLPPQYQCHGDGHICQPSHHTAAKFTVCETGDAEKNRYWWKRSCCEEADKDSTAEVCDLPPDLMKPACPGYTTIYKRDFKDPKKQQNERMYNGNCTACEYCTREPVYDPPNVLCTKDPGQYFITQRGGII